MSRARGTRSRAKPAPRRRRAARAADGGAGERVEPAGRPLERGLALGFLAMLPLFAAYEASLAPGGARNVAELVVSLPLAPFGEAATPARRVALVLAALVAAWAVFERELGLAARVWRIVREGALAAVAIGPLLYLSLRISGAPLDGAVLRAPAPDTAAVARAAFLAGGSAWEELVFRVGLQSLFFTLAIGVVRFLGAERARPARLAADALSIVAGALVFAAAHLAPFVAPFGTGGERFDASVFTWRTLAGILLGVLFRWRGPGVAAWAHAFFNLATSIGAGADVFL